GRLPHAPGVSDPGRTALRVQLPPGAVGSLRHRGPTMTLKASWILPCAAVAVAAAVPVAAQARGARRLSACREMLDEVSRMPEGLPRNLLNKAECVVLVPGVKKTALRLGR